MLVTHWSSGHIALVVFALGLAQSCATIAHGPNQKIDVVTDPPGAVASFEDQRVVTPGQIVVRRKLKDAEIRIEKEGYLTQRVRLIREKHTKPLWLNAALIPVGLFAGGEVGNRTAPDREETCSSSGGFGFCRRSNHLNEIVVGALVGAVVVEGIAFGVDYATGAAFRLEPPRIDVKLEPVPSTPTPQANDRSNPGPKE